MCDRKDYCLGYKVLDCRMRHLECIDGTVGWLMELLGWFALLREFVDTQVGLLRELVDTQVAFLREWVDTQVALLKDFVDKQALSVLLQLDLVKSERLLET